jgi:RND family efflux transporter MFP subunit
MQSFLTWVRALPRMYWGIGVLVVAGGVVIAVQVLRPAPLPAVLPTGTPHVTVASVAALAAPAGPLPVTGTVTSVDQATILAQTSGQIVALNHAIGDRVAAGAVIAAFDNASQKAAVEEAQGAYDAAVVAAERVSGSSTENTTAAALAALASAYSALDDAVHTRADQLFTNARSTAPVLALTVPDSALVAKLANERAALDPVLADVRSLAGSATTSTIAQASASASADVELVLAFLDDLIRAVNETPPSQTASAAVLAADQVSLAAARAETVALLSGITSAKTAYDANSVSAAAAGVKQASGALAAAEAALEKTLVRAPIAGVIVSLPVTQGDFVSMNAPVAIVSNPGSLYIDVGVTSSDARTLSVGNRAVVGGSVPGVVTFIAPALDPMTGKIEVKVALTGNASALTAGEVVPVSLDRSLAAVAPAASASLSIPIIAAKIAPEGPEVFTVSTTSALVAHPVTLGTILGSSVVVVSGVTPDMLIVTDARGLASGETVIVDATSTAP